MTEVSAPGKILLSGEYAVLRGAEAVVAAVDRRAHATYLPKSARDSSEIVRFAMEAAWAFLSSRKIGVDPEAWMTVRSSGFQVGKQKLGLGSSAAVTASTVGAVFEAHGLKTESHLNEILDVSIAAHRSAQKGQGSGADVASSVMGGTIVYAMSKRPSRPVTLPLQIAVVFSGRSVSTEKMLRGVSAFENRDPKGFEECMSELVRLSDALAAAYREGIAAEIIALSGQYGKSMGALGRSARVNIVTKEHQCAMTLAKKLGGSAKPSGAGGGDIAAAFFDSAEASAEFRKQCIRYELVPLNLEVGAEGLRRED